MTTEADIYRKALSEEEAISAKLRARISRLETAIMALATYPVTLTKPPENMDAFNMQLIAQKVLEDSN